MAVTSPWQDVADRYRDLEKYERMRPISAAMLDLVSKLRADPRFEDVMPNMSMASLTLKLEGAKRYVMVSWYEEDPRSYAVSYVDPPLEFHSQKTVPETGVVAAIDDYLNRLR